MEENLIQNVNPIQDISSLNEQEKEEYANELDFEFRSLSEDSLPDIIERLAIDDRTLDELLLIVERLKSLRKEWSKLC